uniref:Transposase n=1 Tax=Aromatoleum buckelii TaxID=200254 RepID=A0ABX1N513_9RHOO
MQRKMSALHAGVSAGGRSVAELEAENARLRKELAEARIERDVIKKAAAYFARESLPGTRS